MNYPCKIVGFVIDIHNLTMYKEDGDTIVVPQGDPRIKELVKKLVEAKAICESIGTAFAYTLVSDDMNDRNYYAETEKKTNGVVRFFRMAKAKVKELVEKFVEPIGFMEVGKTQEMEHSVTGSKAAQAIAEVMEQAEAAAPVPVYPEAHNRPLTKSAAAVEEIMANAVHSSNPNFNDTQGETEDTATTVVAVLEDNTIIPGAEALAEQTAAIAQGVGSSDGMANFLRRAGSMKRGHSVEDLLKFIQKGELPLADDGSVLVYKLLRRTKVEGVFVDCHSGNVKQRVGSFVHMDEKLVDANRSRDCSNGLHVARRDYLGSFHGDVCVLAKLAPEDVIAVPEYDARKLRAKGYHIIAELTDSDRRRVCGNKPMEDQVLLGNAIAGNHAEIIEYVKITEGYGGGVIITPVDEAQTGMPALDHNLAGQSLDHLENKSEPNPEDCQVDARELALKTATKGVPGGYADGDAYRQQAEPVKTVLDPPATPAQPVKVQQARPIDALVQAFRDATGNPLEQLKAAQALLAFKKSAKKSWTALGVAISVWEAATELAVKHDTAVPADPLPTAVPKAVKAKKATKPVAEPAQSTKDAIEKVLAADPVAALSKPAAKKAPAKPKADPKPKAAKPAAITGEKKMTQQEQMAKLVEYYNKNPDKQNAKEIVAYKQKTKKSWDVLGVTDTKFIKKITERAKL